MSWIVVPCLLEGRDQMNARFPNRSKASDGTIGDTSHQASSSSHNPDLTGNPEFRDGDNLDEVRAIDFTTELNDPSVTMEQVVQTWIERCRAGLMPWVRYIIFRRRIWHKYRNNYETRDYTGSDPHTGHVHVTADWDADSTGGTDWGLGVISAPHNPESSGPEPLVVDGAMGPKTISRWQQIMGTTVDGYISHPVSELVEAVQRHLNSAIGADLVVDGAGIAQNGKRYKTVAALQRYLGTVEDGVMSFPKSMVVEALQRRLNEGRF